MIHKKKTYGMMNPRESLTQRLSTHLSTKQSFTPRDSGDSGDSGLFGWYLCLYG